MSTRSDQENLINFNNSFRFDNNESNNVNSPGSNPFDKLFEMANDSTDSLGLLPLNLEDDQFDDENWSNVPEILINVDDTPQNCAENMSNELNLALLYSYRNSKVSTPSSGSSTSCFPDSLKLWELSTISSINSLMNSANISFSILNKGFINDNSYSQINFDKIASERRNSFGNNDFEHIRSKIQSVPDFLEGIHRNEDKWIYKFSEPYFKSFHKSESLLRSSLTLLQVLDVDQDKDEFDDSVFIKAKPVSELYSSGYNPQPDSINIGLTPADEFWESSRLSSTSSLMNAANMKSFSILNRGFINSDSSSRIELDKILNERKNSFEIECCTEIRNGLKDDGNEDRRSYKLSNPLLKNFRKSESLYRRSFSSPHVLNSNQVKDNEVDDFVCVEAKHVASKIEDDSILHLADGELYSLDCIPEPDLMDISFSADDEPPTNCTEKVFKTLDKMIPSTRIVDTGNKRDTITEKSPEENANKTIDSTSSSSSLTCNNCLQNLSEILCTDNKRLSTSRLSHCSNSSKSRDTKSILHNLSEILSSDNLSAQQKSKGQNLLFSLADILCTDDNKNSLDEQSEDSGQSSIDQDALPDKLEGDVSCDALDLRVSIKSTAESKPKQLKPLDLSISKMKSESETNMNIKISVEVNKNNNAPVRSNDGRNISNMKTNISDLPSFGKLKPKSINQRKVISERGPLKAVIPVGHMAKLRGQNKGGRMSTTPTKNGQTISGYKVKRTSTPKTDSKPQPVAQSTPEENCSVKRGIPTPSQLPQRRFGSPVSSLTRTVSIGNDSTKELNVNDRSDSAPNLSSSTSKNPNGSYSNQSMFRRRSASDIKLSKDGNKFRRSNTIDKDSGIAKTLNRVRGNIEKARKLSLVDTKATAGSKEVQNKLVLGERNRNSSSSIIKPCNLVNKMRRNSVKENVCE